MNPNYEKVIQDFKDKAEEIYNSENGIKDLIEKAKTMITESKIADKFSEDIKTSVDLLLDWKDGKYNHVSKESIVGVIVCLLFMIDPFDILPNNNVKTLGKIFIFAYLLKIINDELNKYREWEGNVNHIDNLIELPVQIELPIQNQEN
ncbi:MAG TPA: hypothetical protein VIG40_04440 [Tissierellaceae bacterium]